MDEGERKVLEDLLRRRGVSVGGNAEVEREMLERYQDDCACIVLDSSGFTRITKKHGIIHFLALIVAMRDIVRPIFEKHFAFGHWAEADNLYATFPTGKMALTCALEIMEAVGRENASRKPEERLDVCIGIGSGRMLRIGKVNVYGDEMNLASKLGEDIAGAGEILITEKLHDEVHEELSDLAYSLRRTHVSGVEIPYYLVGSKSLAGPS